MHCFTEVHYANILAYVVLQDHDLGPWLELGNPDWNIILIAAAIKRKYDMVANAIEHGAQAVSVALAAACPYADDALVQLLKRHGANIWNMVYFSVNKNKCYYTSPEVSYIAIAHGASIEQVEYFWKYCYDERCVKVWNDPFVIDYVKESFREIDQGLIAAYKKAPALI